MKKQIWILLSLFVFFPMRTAHAEVHLWPILELSKEETTVLYPLFAYDEKMLMVFPLYFHLPQEREHHLLWPLIKVRDGRLTRVAPFWFNENKDEFLFLPFISSSSSGTYVVIPPMHIDREGELRAVFPFYMSSTEPVAKNPSQVRETRHILWPLYTKTEVRDANGLLVSRERRWLVFSEGIEEDGSHTRRILGIPLWERSSGRGSERKTPETSSLTSQYARLPRSVQRQREEESESHPPQQGQFRNGGESPRPSFDSNPQPVLVPTEEHHSDSRLR